MAANKPQLPRQDSEIHTNVNCNLEHKAIDDGTSDEEEDIQPQKIKQSGCNKIFDIRIAKASMPCFC